jgi:hypothetical protein
MVACAFTGNISGEATILLGNNYLEAMRTRQGRRYFTEHDGFRTDAAVDVTALISHVKAATGYEIKIGANQLPIALL